MPHLNAFCCSALRLYIIRHKTMADQKHPLLSPKDTLETTGPAFAIREEKSFWRSVLVSAVVGTSLAANAILGLYLWREQPRQPMRSPYSKF